jgi:hypothetical protein
MRGRGGACPCGRKFQANAGGNSVSCWFLGSNKVSCYRKFQEMIKMKIQLVSVVVLAALLFASPLHATELHDSEIDDVVASMNSEVSAIADLATPDFANVDESTLLSDFEHLDLPSDADIEALSQDVDSLIVEAHSIYNVEVSDKKLFKKVKAAVKKVATKVKNVAKKVAVAVKKVAPVVAAAALVVPGVGVAVGAVKAKVAAAAAKIKSSTFVTKAIKTAHAIKSKVDKVKKVVKKVQSVRNTVARARDCLKQNGCVKAAVKSAAKSFVKSQVAAAGGAVVSRIKNSNVGKAVAATVNSVRSSVRSAKGAVVSRINDGASKLRSRVPQKLQGTFDRVDRSVRAGAASAASKLRDRAVRKIGESKPVARATKALKSIRDKVSTFSSNTGTSEPMVVTSAARPDAQPVLSSSGTDRPILSRPRSSSSSGTDRPILSRPRSSSSSGTDRPILSRPRSSSSSGTDRPILSRPLSSSSSGTVRTDLLPVKSCGEGKVKWGSKCINAEHGGPLSTSSSGTVRPNLSRARSSIRPVPRRSSFRATPRSRPVRVRVSKAKSGVFLKIVINALEQAGYDADDVQDFENESVFDDLD